jgi:hypothetical protein
MHNLLIGICNDIIKIFGGYINNDNPKKIKFYENLVFDTNNYIYDNTKINLFAEDYAPFPINYKDSKSENITLNASNVENEMLQMKFNKERRIKLIFSLSEKKVLVAEELKLIMFYCSKIVFYNNLLQSEMKIINLISEIVRIVFSNEIIDFNFLNDLIIEFLKKRKFFFSSLPINYHLLLHFGKECIKTNINLIKMFSGERIQGEIKEIPTNNKSSQLEKTTVKRMIDLKIIKSEYQNYV